jgi:DNA-3-methyladenine glycosylase
MVKQSGHEWQPIKFGDLMGKRATTKPIHRVRRFHRAELPVNTVKLARFLIGMTLVHDTPQGWLSGRIVETEAYPPGDPAGHASVGLTRANRSLFLVRGSAYIRFIYGSCWLFNIASETKGVGAGVLIRALEPLDGIPLMQRYRGISRLLDLARGPGRLSEALHIDNRFDGIDLCSRNVPIWLGSATRPVGDIGVSTRIGISRATRRRLRFYERGNPFVSGPLWLRP